MRDAARFLLVGCLLLASACNINPLPTPGGGGGLDVGRPTGGDTGGAGGGSDAAAPASDAAAADVAGPADAAEDALAPDAGDDAGGDAAPDGGADALAPDALGPLGPTDPLIAPVEPVCEPFEGFPGGRLWVTLAWTTAEPAVCAASVSLQGGPFWARSDAVFAEPATAFTWEHWLYTYDAWAAPPAAGDEIAWRVDCGPPGAVPAPDESGRTVRWTLAAAEADCIWPFDRGCGDGSVLWCRPGAPTECPDDGMVLTVQEDCWRCVYAATCACDDGSEAVCPQPQPECPVGTILAVQDGCWVCADPLMCTPLAL